MSKRYREWSPDQVWMFPPSPRDWLPEDHLVYFLMDVVDRVDLSPIFAFYEMTPQGQPPFHPRMMVTLLLYAYCTGVFSSRKMMSRCESDAAFRVIVGEDIPDFRTISRFRQTHLSVMKELFVEVLRLCGEAGLIKVGRLALDGTKVKANASRHKAMSYDRMGQEEERLKREIDDLLQQAQITDEEEDSRHGQDRRGDELPEELARRESRLKKIQEAKAALEEQAQANLKSAGVEARPKQVTADAGYYSEANVSAAEAMGIDPFIATQRLKHHEEIPPAPKGRIPDHLSAQQKMARKLRTKKGRETYSKRKGMIEPVFGQIKGGRGFRQFFMRGLKKMQGEWTLVCLTHNLLKLHRAKAA